MKKLDLTKLVQQGIDPEDVQEELEEFDERQSRLPKHDPADSQEALRGARRRGKRSTTGSWRSIVRSSSGDGSSRTL